MKTQYLKKLQLSCKSMPRIMIVSSMPWGFLWQRPQQIASRLADRGFEVVYFHSPLDLSPLFLIKLFRKKSFFVINKVNSNLCVVNLFVPPFRGKLRFFTEKFGMLFFKIYVRCFDLKPSVALFYHPQDVFLAECLESMGVKIAYDCVDDYSAFPGISDPFAVLNAEWRLVKKSFVVIAVSKMLYERISKANSNCILVPNGADFKHFNKAVNFKEKPLEIENLRRPIIGFTGVVWDWIDIDLICKLAELHPEYSILLVGPVYFGEDKLGKFSNIFAMGHKPYEVLPQYLACMDVCLIPFKLNKLTLASNPIKLYEYLAAGKPVVSTALPEICESASDLVYIARDEEDFIKKVEEAVREAESPNEELIAKRIKFAKENSWENRVRTIEKLLQKYLVSQ